MQPSSINPSYLPQVDSLRAFAVAAVLLHHWFQFTWVDFGGYGVTLFFVISGYLITGSIYRLRDGGMPGAAAAQHFFGRRVLRLFPAYYLMLIVGSMLSADVRNHWLWYATYLSNFVLGIEQRYIALTPAWSLAVEEQFYILWFFIVWMLRPRTLSYILVGFVLVAPLFRFLCVGPNVFASYMLWAHCDALAIGAALCFMERNRQSLPRVTCIVAAYAASLLIGASFLITPSSPWMSSLGRSVFTFLAGWLVWQARVGFSGSVGNILSHPWTVYLGKISYGVYLYHMIAPGLANFLHLTKMPLIWRLFMDGTAVGFVGHVVMTVVIAAVSFRYFETPLRYAAFRKPTLSAA